MSILSDLVSLLVKFVKDTAPLAEAEILALAKEKRILLRDDHIKFLANFSAPPNGRLGMFKSYGGDFDFWAFRDAYLDEEFPVEVPTGHTYFGTSFAGISFCINFESGEIFQNDEDQRGGLVHEGIEGFLLRCMVLAYGAEAFSSRVVRQNLDADFINEFRLKNNRNKIRGGDTFVGGHDNIDSPKTLVEHYIADGQLIYLFLPTNDITIFSGGVLNDLI